MTAARGRRTVVVAIAVLIAVVSCGDPYGVANPYDPDFPVTFTVTGPDTLLSLGEVAQYSAQTDPAFPDTAFRWATGTATISAPGAADSVVDGATILAPGAAGSFASVIPPLEPRRATVLVEALIGSVDTTLLRIFDTSYVTVHTTVPRHVGYKSVIVTQRLTRIQLRCPTLHACDTISVGDSLSVWVDGFDGRGLQIAELRTAHTNPATGTPIATYVIRDTTIATFAPLGVRVAAVTALKAGTTWIVGARGPLSDSLQLVVR